MLVDEADPDEKDVHPEMPPVIPDDAYGFTGMTFKPGVAARRIERSGA